MSVYTVVLYLNIYIDCLHCQVDYNIECVIGVVNIVFLMKSGGFCTSGVSLIDCHMEIYLRPSSVHITVNGCISGMSVRWGSTVDVCSMHLPRMLIC